MSKPTHAYVRRRACGHPGELVVDMRGVRPPAPFRGGSVERVTMAEARALAGELCFGRCKEAARG